MQSAGAVALFVAVMSFGLLRGIGTVEIFMVAISQMVSMVPEGLPVAMTIALSVGMQRMAARGAIVRRLVLWAEEARKLLARRRLQEMER